MGLYPLIAALCLCKMTPVAIGDILLPSACMNMLFLVSLGPISLRYMLCDAYQPTHHKRPTYFVTMSRRTLGFKNPLRQALESVKTRSPSAHLRQGFFFPCKVLRTWCLPQPQSWIEGCRPLLIFTTKGRRWDRCLCSDNPRSSERLTPGVVKTATSLKHEASRGADFISLSEECRQSVMGWFPVDLAWMQQELWYRECDVAELPPLEFCCNSTTDISSVPSNNWEGSLIATEWLVLISFSVPHVCSGWGQASRWGL